MASVTALSGGCINNGARITTDRGTSYFLKWNARAPAGMFTAEAEGLRALAAAATGDRGPCLRVPRVLACEDRAEQPGWLLLEHIAKGRSSRDSDERLGHGLAAIHRSPVGPPGAGGADVSNMGDMGDTGVTGDTGDPGDPGSSEAGDGGARRFGWSRDNWIGSLPQANTPAGSWAVFWRDQRIAPQLRMARERGFLHDARLDDMLDVIPAALAGVDRPELLHGDLWGGNAYVDTEGAPVLIDPAVYLGDGEVDLAMTELFGGFGDAFYGAYNDRKPISDAYGAYRRDLYQLYYLLVHVNLFGGSYEAGARRAAEVVVAEWG